MHGLTCNVVKLFMEMDSKLFDQCSAEYKKKQEEESAKLEKKQKDWGTIEKMAEGHPAYPTLKENLQPKASVAYAMRATQLKEASTAFEGGADGGAGDFKTPANAAPVSSADNTPEGLRRKSMLPARGGATATES